MTVTLSSALTRNQLLAIFSFTSCFTFISIIKTNSFFKLFFDRDAFLFLIQHHFDEEHFKLYKKYETSPLCKNKRYQHKPRQYFIKFMIELERTQQSLGKINIPIIKLDFEKNKIYNFAAALFSS